MYHPLQQLVRSRPRLIIAACLGFLAELALPPGLQFITRILCAWNVAVWCYLLSAGWLMMRASHAQVRRIAAQEERSAVAVLAILSVAAVVSVAAIVVELAQAKNMGGETRFLHYVLTGATVIGAWLLVVVIFTFHYAYMYFSVPRASCPLRFPDDPKEPDYWDFLYFAFTIAVAAQTSDITIVSRGMRKVVLAQSILSFFFNAAIIGFSINIAAGLTGS
jgi:uncharacterized membrane protein